MIIIKLRKFCVAAFVMLAVASLLGTQAAQAGENTIIQASKRAYKVTAVVEPDLCIALSLGSCSEVGATGPAAAGNDFIVGTHFYVTGSLGAIGGLGELDFNVTTITSPSGNAPDFLRTGACAPCFSEPQPGVYRMAIRPSGSSNWSSGTYMLLLDVNIAPGVTVSMLLPVKIP